MKLHFQHLLLPAGALFIMAACFSCQKYSPDEPFPPVYTSSVFTGSNNKIVYSLDPNTGETKWKTPVDGEVHATPVLFNNSLWVATTEGTLYQMDYKTGAIINTKEFLGPIEGTPLPFNGNLLVPAGQSLVYMNIGDMNDTIWIHSFGGQIMSSPTTHAIPGVNDQAIFVSDMNNKVTALDPDGGQIWQYAPAGGGAFYSSPCVVNDSFLYIGNDNGNLYAINTQDGSEKWVFPTQGEVRSSPVSIGGNIIVGSNDRYLYSVDSFTGLLRWKAHTGDQIVSSPSVDNQFVYFGCYDNYLYCVDIIDGEVKWKKLSFGLIKSSPLVYGGAVYIGSFDKILYKLDTADGGEIWAKNIQGQMENSVILDTVGGAAVPSISGTYKY